MTPKRPDITVSPAFFGTASARFKDAMLVRTEVFVEEQKVPAENERDDDDDNSFHWVAYAASSTSPSSAPIPIATARLVLPPYDPHPREGPAVHPPEGYLKIGRLATRKPWRGMGVGGLVVEEVVRFAGEELGKRMQDVAGNGSGIKWDGRLLAHAQIQVKGAWMRMGFFPGSQVEKGEELGMVELGEWIEEGIMHCAVWRMAKVEQK